MRTTEERLTALEKLVTGGVWVTSSGGVGGVATGGSASILPPRRTVSETIIIIARDGDGEPFEKLPDFGQGRRAVPASGRVLMPNGLTYYLDPTVFRYVMAGTRGGLEVTPDEGVSLRFMFATPIKIATKGDVEER